MNYLSVRNKIRSGDLIAFSYRQPLFHDWYSFKVGLVRMFTKSEFSHVGVVWVAANRVFLIEAVVPKVRIYPLSNALLEGEDAYWLPLGVEWTQAAEEFAMRHVGQEYSQMKAMRALYTPWEHGDSTECAGMVIDVLHVAGVDLGARATPSAVVRAAESLCAPCTLITNS
jgi:hypothetical protein